MTYQFYWLELDKYDKNASLFSGNFYILKLFFKDVEKSVGEIAA
jgi:hypothetical protein